MELALRLLYEVPPIWSEPQQTTLTSPLLGWVLEPGSRSWSIDAPVAINSLGLRDDEFPREKPPGEYRVLCLGDSFTFALGVRFEDIYAQQLERMLAERHPRTAVQVINAGVGGYNTRQERIYLETDGLSFDPDVVTVGFYWNDLVYNEEPLPDLATTPRLGPSPEVRGLVEHDMPKWLRDILRRSLVLYLGTTRTKQLINTFDPPASRYGEVQRALLHGDAAFLEPYWQATAEHLLALERAARERGIPVVLLVFPMENQIKLDFPEMALTETLRALWAPTGMPFVDLEPAYRAALERGENPFLPYDLHPNATGMRLAAEALYDSLAAHGLLPPPAAP